jgi:hypothetical protein
MTGNRPTRSRTAGRGPAAPSTAPWVCDRLSFGPPREA